MTNLSNVARGETGTVLADYASKSVGRCLAVLFAGLLAACGGGEVNATQANPPSIGGSGTGGNNTATVTNPGMWTGTVTTPQGTRSLLVFAEGGNRWAAVVTEDARLIDVFFDDINTKNTGQGFVTPQRGQTLSSGSSIDSGSFTTTASGSTSRQVSVLFDKEGRYDLQMTYSTARSDNLNSDPSVVMGSYSGMASDRTSFSLTLDSKGKATGTDSLGCSYDFTVYQYFAPKNIHDLGGDRLCNGTKSTVVGVSTWEFFNGVYQWVLLLDGSSGHVFVTLRRS